MGYKWCAVRQCKNTSEKTPEKLFISVPKDAKVRKQWLQIARRNPKEIEITSNVFFCEDHFNLKEDMANYMEYKLLGSVKRILLKKNCVPSKFDCQPDRKWKSTKNGSRAAFAKRQRLALIEDAKNTLKTKEILPLEKTVDKQDTEVQKIVEEGEIDLTSNNSNVNTMTDDEHRIYGVKVYYPYGNKYVECEVQFSVIDFSTVPVQLHIKGIRTTSEYH